MQIPKGMIVERLRAAGQTDLVSRAEAELPEKVDTERDGELLRSLDLDPGRSPTAWAVRRPAIG